LKPIYAIADLSLYARGHVRERSIAETEMLAWMAIFAPEFASTQPLREALRHRQHPHDVIQTAVLSRRPAQGAGLLVHHLLTQDHAAAALVARGAPRSQYGRDAD
jgi:S-adenosylhomocysteine hydrolase